MAPMMTVGTFWPRVGAFGALGGGGGRGVGGLCSGSGARRPRTSSSGVYPAGELQRGGFSDTSLVISILDIVYDCHFYLAGKLQ